MASFDKYTLTKLLNQRGFIDTYDAYDTEANRPVTLHLIAATPTEAQLEALHNQVALRHPHIAHVYEVEVIGDKLAIAVEPFEDDHLADRLPLDESLDTIAWQLNFIASALDYAHERGLVHGHLTPDSIVITDVDEPIIADFGLDALWIDTADAYDLYRAAYAAPEQAHGDPGTPASDVYALGAILYEMLTGYPPFRGESPAELLEHHGSTLPASDKLPNALEYVIMRALAKQPDQRFNRASDLSKAFAMAITTPAEASNEMPQAIGRYAIDAELGPRGKYLIYRAHDVLLGRPVAIKILLSEYLADQAFITQFQRDIELLATLEHPSVVKVYDFGEYFGRPYVVMPYLAGGTLEIRIKNNGPLSPQEAMPVIERIASALDAAHQRNIIHAQVRPRTILFDDDQHAYLADFSIAASDSWTRLHDPENAEAAAKYMSPEQVQALISDEAATLDARTDVYALGTVLFEMLTGQPPFHADTPYDTAMLHLNAPVPLVQDYNPQLPKMYQTLFDKTLAKDPAQRYVSAGSVARRMKELLAGRWYLSRITTDSEIVPTVDHEASSPPPSDIDSSPKFGRYALQHQLGRGGMGTVYLAYDVGMKRQVAIKLLPHRLVETPGFRARFEAEARLIAMLNHDAIAQVYDFGEYNEQPFIVMPYLPGGTLSDKLKPKGMRLRQISPIVDRLAAALDAAHTQNIVHRDVKPGNVLFNQHNEAFLADFGIAVLQTAESSSAADNLGGTPRYMSPEQVRAIMEQTPHSVVDKRGDIYALGIMLFEMLTGQTPFGGATARELALAHIHDPIPRLDTIKDSLPAEAQAVIDKALAKDPDERYQTASALAKDVQDLTGSRWLLRQIME